MINKVLSILVWIGVLLIQILGYVGGVLLYPIAWLLKKSVYSTKIPLWWWFDDEDGLFGAEYWRKAKKITKLNFWTSYRWCALRNPMWNLYSTLVPKKGDEVIVYSKGKLTRGNDNLSLYNVATFFYVDKDGRWTNNAGEFLSLQHSILGWVFIWFTIQDKLYWRFSYTGNVFWKLWLEIQLGVGWRYTFRIKFKWNPKLK